MDSTPVDFDRVRAVVEEAGALAMTGWREGRTDDDAWEKAPGHIVSESDIAVNAFLRERLEALLPQAGWLSEETRADRSRSGRRFAWVVDPIDGTKDFVRGRPGWCVSVALVENGAPVMAVLSAPARDELWEARAGAFTRRNGVSLVAGGRTGYDGARIPLDRLPDGVDLVAVPKPNSIALRLAMVAADEADLVVSTRWGYEWDIAAAHLIAREAGARVTDAFGGELVYNGTHGQAFGVLCTVPGIHAEAVQRVAPFALEARNSAKG